MYDQSIVITKVNKDVWPKYCITKVNKVLYCITKVNKDVLPKYCLTKVNKRKHCITKVNKDVWPKYCITKKVNKVLYYKSKQRCYDQSIVLQK